MQPHEPVPAPARQIRVAGDRFVHADGSPFLWLSDTWWWGASALVSDDEFRRLSALRAGQGFTVVQLVVGPGSDADADDPRQGNDGGPAFGPDGTTDPGYLDVAERRIRTLIEHGILPCIVGAWGYHLEAIGVQRMIAHWLALIERFAGLPVVWCAAGEALMPHYAALGTTEVPERIERLRVGWEEVLRAIRAADPHRRPITAHPSAGVGHLASSDMVDAELIDFVMLQTGHAGTASIEPSLATLERVRSEHPDVPVLNAEACYEGIMGSSWQDVQRFLFWSNLLGGAAGHGYGAQGLWGFDRGLPDDLGRRWGAGTWQEASEYPGARQLGAGARMLGDLGWLPLVPSPHRVRPAAAPEARTRALAAEAPDDTLLVYLPSPAMSLGGDGIPELTVAGLSVGHRARWIDPRTAQAGPEFEVRADAGGEWTLHGDALGVAPTTEDWILAIDAPG